MLEIKHGMQHAKVLEGHNIVAWIYGQKPSLLVKTMVGQEFTASNEQDALEQIKEVLK